MLYQDRKLTTKLKKASGSDAVGSGLSVSQERKVVHTGQGGDVFTSLRHSRKQQPEAIQGRGRSTVGEDAQILWESRVRTSYVISIDGIP